MTQYYIDADNGSDAADGLTAGSTDWLTLNKFLENARSAGDIATMRRGMIGTYDDGGDCLSVVDGDPENPIIVEADYGNNWSDDAASSQSYTMVFGSKTHTASATITGVSVGDWVYNSTDGDDNREFSYEVAAVSGTTLTLFLPYKGSTGATKTLTIMPASPVYGSSTAFAFDIKLQNDNFHKFQGLETQSTDNAGHYNIADCIAVLKDCTCKGDGATVRGFSPTTSGNVHLYKCRTHDIDDGGLRVDGRGGRINATDCLVDGNSATASTGLNVQEGGPVHLTDTEFKNHATSDIEPVENNSIFGRNVILASTTEVNQDASDAGAEEDIRIEDYGGTLGDTRQFGKFSTAADTAFIQSDTGTTRAGGGNISIKVTPSDKLGTAWEYSRLKLFEHAFYATTSSKTYTVFFASDTTTEWTADPSAAELYLEFEAWGHASNNYRKITKSTGAVDFTTDTDYDQSLAVTVAPAQAGVAYLRCFYAKTKESAKANIFRCDPKPVVT